MGRGLTKVEKHWPSIRTCFSDCAVVQLLKGLCAHKFHNFTTWTDLLQEQTLALCVNKHEYGNIRTFCNESTVYTKI